MRFLGSSILALLCASAVVAFPNNLPRDASALLNGNDIASSNNEVAKRAALAEVYTSEAAGINTFKTRSAAAEEEIQVTETEVTETDNELVALDPDDKDIIAYLRDIDTSKLTGSYGEKQWNDVHGDTKSKSGGKYNIQVIHDSGDVYRARVIDKKKKVRKVVTVPKCSKNKAPTLGRAVHYLRKAYGGATPPGC